MGRLLSVDEAAGFLNVPERFIRRIIHQRRIAVVRIGRYVRLAERDLEEFVAAGREEPPDVRRSSLQGRRSVRRETPSPHRPHVG